METPRPEALSPLMHTCMEIKSCLQPKLIVALRHLSPGPGQGEGALLTCQAQAVTARRHVECKAVRHPGFVRCVAGLLSVQ